MELTNASFDQLDPGIPKSGDILAFKDMAANKTKRFYFDELMVSTANNFEWVSDNNPGYALNAIVTYGAKIWQSKIANNLNIVPGTDASKWELLTKAVNWARWAAGAFLDTDVFVIRLIDGEDHIVQLVSVTRPYNSTNFDTEYAAGDWKSLTQNMIVKAATLGLNTVQLDLNMLKNRIFNVGNLIEAKTWSLLKSTNMQQFKAVFQVSGVLHIQTFPAAWQVSTVAGIWNDAANTWTPTDEGFYELEAVYIGAVLYVKLTQL